MANGDLNPAPPAAGPPPVPDPPSAAAAASSRPEAEKPPRSPAVITGSALRQAWQPVTPAGIAAFAFASFNRLLLVQALVASLWAAAIIWFLSTAWFPVLRAAIGQLPEHGAITNGLMNLPAGASGVLAEGQLLAVSLNLEERGRVGATADVCLDLRRDRYHVSSILGHLTFAYPRHRVQQFNRHELEPLWGAWEPVMLVMIALLAVGGLLLLWSLLAALYCWVPRTLAFFADRQLNWGGSWRLAAAALLPGALLLSLGVVLYGLEVLDVLRLGIFAAVHILVGWIYLVVSPFALPRAVAVSRPSFNPFASTIPPEAQPDAASPLDPPPPATGEQEGVQREP